MGQQMINCLTHQKDWLKNQDFFNENVVLGICFYLWEWWLIPLKDMSNREKTIYKRCSSYQSEGLFPKKHWWISEKNFDSWFRFDIYIQMFEYNEYT